MRRFYQTSILCLLLAAPAWAQVDERILDTIRSHPGLAAAPEAAITHLVTHNKATGNTSTTSNIVNDGSIVRYDQSSPSHQPSGMSRFEVDKSARETVWGFPFYDHSKIHAVFDDGSSMTSDSTTRTTSIKILKGRLFPLATGNKLVFEYIARNKSSNHFSDLDPSNFDDDLTFRIELLVGKRLRASELFRSLPGDAYEIYSTWKGSSEPIELVSYFAEDLGWNLTRDGIGTVRSVIRDVQWDKDIAARNRARTIAAKGGVAPPTVASEAPSQQAPAPQAAAAPSAFPDAPLDVTFPKAPVRPDDIAVIIGNADYGKQGKDIPDVTPARADARSFRRYVSEALGVRPGNIIDLADATGTQLAQVFGSESSHKGKLFNWVKPGVSRVTIYYAGHGAPAGDDGSAFLVPTDADAAMLELSGYPLSRLYRNLSLIPAKSITVVLEACFSGAGQGGSVISNASPVFLKAKPPTVPANVTVISAGAANQMASWEEDQSHGLFTKYFLKAMSGEADANHDGTVNLDELDLFLKDTLTYYARRYYGRDQHAQIVVGKAE